MTSKTDSPTKEQLRSLLVLWQRSNQGMTYLQFRRTAWISHLMGCMLVGWCNMQIGIEPDGYTHS